MDYRRNDELNNKKIKKSYKKRNKQLAISALVGLAIILAAVYSNKKAEMEGRNIDPRTGYLTPATEEATSSEVFENMFGRGH